LILQGRKNIRLGRPSVAVARSLRVLLARHVARRTVQSWIRNLLQEPVVVVSFRRLLGGNLKLHQIVDNWSILLFTNTTWIRSFVLRMDRIFGKLYIFNG